MRSAAKVIIKAFALFLCLFLFTRPIAAQKVGVVLSGGGASGISHIGVLKALEQNNIPVDYITGTSSGALVGCLYAMGYSPDRIEQLVKSEQFRNWAYGNIDNKYVYYFKRRDDNASWINIKLSLDSALESSLPTNLISPIPVDFALMEVTSLAIASAGYNFDSLFVPFRCVASDIEHKQSVVFRSGDLGEAVRASMSYPFYLKPLSVDGKLLFDGGIYNNFPSNVMLNDFFPDVVIGSNVSDNAPPPNEDNLISQLKAMLLSKTDYKIDCENGIIIQPKTDIGLFEFDNLQQVIDSGYVATMRQMPLIKKTVTRRAAFDELKEKRSAFMKKQDTIVFDKINIEGLNSKQSEYVRRILRHKNKTVTLEQLKPEYFRLAADEKIKHIYPKAKHNPATGYYDLFLKVKKEKDLIVNFGGNVSNRPINEGFVSVQYNYLGKAAMGITGNTYFGKLYTSLQVKTRFDFSSKLPFYIEPNVTYNRWDFFKSSAAFFEDIRPPFLIQREEFGELNAGFPSGNKGKIIIGGGGGNITDKYYQTDKFSSTDTVDRTDFSLITATAIYERNTLNRKQYPSQGTYFTFKARVVQGEEFTQPGSTSPGQNKFRKVHEWVQLKAIYDKYFNRTGKVKFGLYGEGVFSTQPLFDNYTASILSAQAFQPIPESKTLFQENYRSHIYAAAGLKTIFSIRKSMELRVEGYVYQPYQQILKTADLKAELSDPLTSRFFLGTAAAVYHSPLGPVSFSVNYYDKEKTDVTFLFHFGYILFNKRVLD